MKFVYLILWIIFIVLDIIIFFQNISNNNYFLVFKKFIPAPAMLLYVFIFSFLWGALLVLWIKWLLSNSKEIDDWFDL